MYIIFRVYQALQLTHSYFNMFIIASSFYNQLEMPFYIFQDYSSPQLCSLVIENISRNSLNSYSESLHVYLETI